MLSLDSSRGPNDLRTQLLQYVRDLWRRRWHAIGAAWAICALGWFIVSQLPDTYESSARVYMNADEALTPLLKGIAPDSNVAARLDRLQRTLLSASNMRKLIRMTDLDMRVGDSAARQAMVARLQRNIKVKIQSRSLFTISYTDTDPVLAQSVVSNVLSLFMESSTRDSRSDIDSAQRFLQSEIDRLETVLRYDERKKAEFQSRYYDLLPDDQSGLSRLDQARSDVEKATEELNDALAQRDSLLKQREAQPEFIVSLAVAAVPAAGHGLSTSARTRLAQLETRLQIAKATMTDLHPVVIALNHQIELVRSKLAKLPVNRSGAGRGNAANPLYHDLSIQLVNKTTAIASLRRRIASAELYRDKLEDQARRAPSVAADFMNLNRDYGIVKKNYEALLARRESARIGENADRKSDKITVRTIDPPEVPILPSGPNRPLLLSMVFAVSLGAGLGLAFLLRQIDSSFSTTTALEAMGLPVLGGIDRIASLDPRRRNWLTNVPGFVSACLILAVLYGALVLFSVIRPVTHV
jgi:polysaccharide chain length determinant protein (PEP-CTERM system associated)